MESNSEYAAAARAADRAEAAPWVDYPPTPAWYPPAAGLWAAAIPAVFVWLDATPRVLAVFALTGLELAFLAWYRRYRGTMPTGHPPREFRKSIVVFVLALIGVAILATGLVFADQWVLAVVATFVLVTGVVWWYERAYDLAAARIRERLG